MLCSSPAYLVIVLCASVAFQLTTSSPISNPHFNDSAIDNIIPGYFDSKKGKLYHRAVPAHVSDVTPVRYDPDDASCNVEFKLRWSANVGSAVYSTPLIYPAGPDGTKQIFTTTYYQHVEVLGYDGFKPWGWPLNFEGSSFRGSPILFDVDGDGAADIGVVDKNANLYWIKMGSFGQYLEDYHTKVPKLKVRKDWFKGLDPDFADHMARTSMFDYHGPVLDKLKNDHAKRHAKLDELASFPKIHEDKESLLETSRSNHQRSKTSARKLMSAIDPDASPDGGTAVDMAFEEEKELMGQGLPPEPGEEMDDYAEYLERRHQNIGGFGDGGPEDMQQNELTDDGMVPPDYRGISYGGAGMSYGGGFHESVRNGYAADFYGSMEEEGGDGQYLFVDPHVLSSPTLADVNSDGNLELVMAVSYYFDAADYAGKDLDYDIGNYVAGAVVSWDIEGQRWNWVVNLDLSTDKTLLKAHIYGSPTVVDLDGDGRSEVVVGTAMGLLYVLDGDTGFVRRHFPMQFGPIECQMAVADLTGDGALEIVVVDMYGNIVIVNADGEVIWDMQIPTTQGTSESESVQSPKTAYASIPYTPGIGDVDNDGQLDIVVVSVESEKKMIKLKNGSMKEVTSTKSTVWALNGATGLLLAGYPIALPKGAVISAGVLLIDLHDYSANKLVSLKQYSDPTVPLWLLEHDLSLLNAVNSSATMSSDTDSTNAKLRGKKERSESGSGAKGLHIIIPSYDGHVYVIDGVKGCAERLDVGEHVYSMPLFDDVTGDGFLDMLVGTMNGEMLLFETSIPHHPLNSWPSYPKHRLNGFTHGMVGISIPADMKKTLLKADIQGDMGSLRIVELTFDIFDNRVKEIARNKLFAAEKKGSFQASTEGDDNNAKKSYAVTVSRGTNKLEPLAQSVFTVPGRYTIKIPMAPPESATLVLSMTTEHGQYYEDIVTVSLNTRFYVWIKYLIVVPVLLVSVQLLLMKKS